MILLHPTSFPNIGHFSAIIQAEKSVFEGYDNYVKQTYRNRYEIYSPNGKLPLTVPVNYTQKNRQLYKDVKIANEDHWQQQHLKSLQTAYNMSPFYEFYENELMPIFTKPFDFIFDFNLKCLEVLCDCLQIQLDIDFTESFEISPKDLLDYREWVNPKATKPIPFKPYTQVFTDKYGFIPNLSILDLLFNEGPNALTYLEQPQFTT